MSRRLKTPAASDSPPEARRPLVSIELYLVADSSSAAALEEQLMGLDGVRYAEVGADRLHVRALYDPGVISAGLLLAASRGTKSAIDASRPCPGADSWSSR